ncbi:MAG TPA: UvrB/UvrC motif-containing protein, partial [Thermoanaerobaculia bacterium]
DRKLLRDLVQHKGQVLTIALVVACGIAGFLAAMGTYLSLVAARDDYYAQARFADIFVALKRAPEALGRRIGELEGRMKEAARRLDFEQAAELRDRLRALRKLQVVSYPR